MRCQKQEVHGKPGVPGTERLALGLVSQHPSALRVSKVFLRIILTSAKEVHQKLEGWVWAGGTRRSLTLLALAGRFSWIHPCGKTPSKGQKSAGQIKDGQKGKLKYQRQEKV